MNSRAKTPADHSNASADRVNAPVDPGEWSDIEAFLSEVTELARAPASLREFADATLSRTLDLLEAIGGAVWLANDLGRIECVSTAGTDPTKASAKPGTDPTKASAKPGTDPKPGTEHDAGTDPKIADLLSMEDASHRQFLAEMSRQVGTRRSLIRGSDGSDLLRLAASCRLDDQSMGIVEVVQPASMGEEALAGNEKLLVMVGQLTESFHQRHQRRESLREQDEFRQREMFFRRVHESLELGPTAYRIVNEGRQLIGCDRVSLAVADRRGFSVIAISGTEAVESGSEVVRSMGALATAVAKTSQWLQFRG
ncbi:MAG: hypothetical protein AAFU85_30145, partial [Planctomycetota bacterium]